MIEQTLVIFKPDVLFRGLTGELLTRFERIGFKIVAMKMLQVDATLAAKHYEKDDEWLLTVGKKLIKNQNLDPEKEDPMEHGMKICNSLAKDLCISPVIAMVLEGHNTISIVRKLLGEQSPEISNPGTIRFDYAMDTYRLANKNLRPVINLVHASDSRENAKKEIELWFSKNEIYKWSRADDPIHFRKGE